MPLKALVLIVIAAVGHSVWNFLAKRAAKHKNFIWFASALEAALFLPAAAWALWDSWPRLGWRAALFLLATGFLHLLYTDSLLRGYRTGDYSFVYPVARGTGPLLAFVGACVFLGERPALLAAAGVSLVALGILLLSGFASAGSLSWSALFWGVATGVTIAGYTLVDAYSVKALVLAPILVEYAGNFVRLILLSGSILRRPRPLATEWRLCWKEALGVAVLTPAAYVLVLMAMRIAPVSHVAPAREMSMMMGAYLGARFLGEPHFARRLTASALIAAGVAALAVG